MANHLSLAFATSVPMADLLKFGPLLRADHTGCVLRPLKLKEDALHTAPKGKIDRHALCASASLAMTVGIHLCRGNLRAKWSASGRYASRVSGNP